MGPAILHIDAFILLFSLFSFRIPSMQNIIVKIYLLKPAALLVSQFVIHHIKFKCPCYLFFISLPFPNSLL